MERAVVESGPTERHPPIGTVGGIEMSDVEGRIHVQPEQTSGRGDQPQDVGTAFDVSGGLPVYVADDFLVLTTGLYEFFMAEKANDAFRVYMHLLYTAKRQDKRSVWANTGYLSVGCGMGSGRVKAAKAWLAAKGVIQYRQEVSSSGPKKLRGSKVYIVLNTTIHSGGPAIGTPDSRDARQPTDEVLREQDKPQENNESAVAIAPARMPKAKHSPEEIALHKRLGDVFCERAGKWQHGAKEATALYKLIDYARAAGPDRAALLVEAFWKLHKGELYGMTEGEKRWWASIPFVPSRLDAKAVETMMERVQAANYVSPEYLAQLEKDYGEKIRKRQAIEAGK